MMLLLLQLRNVYGYVPEPDKCDSSTILTMAQCCKDYDEPESFSCEFLSDLCQGAWTDRAQSGETSAELILLQRECDDLCKETKNTWCRTKWPSKAAIVGMIVPAAIVFVVGCSIFGFCSQKLREQVKKIELSKTQAPPQMFVMNPAQGAYIPAPAPYAWQSDQSYQSPAQGDAAAGQDQQAPALQ
jgi:hypothetical protein